MFILSIDVDVGCRKLGLINKGENDKNVSRYFGEYRVGAIEEMALPFFVKLFNDFEVPATFAIRGQSLKVDGSFFELIRNSSVKHDIGAHGYSHEYFENISVDEARDELSMVAEVMEKIGVAPKSFVFPGNSVAYLDLLEDYGYKCYRSRGGLTTDCMCIEKKGRLYNIHPSLCLDQTINPFFVKKALDVAIEKKLPFHAWLHVWEFGETKEHIQKKIAKVFSPLLAYGKRMETLGELTFETMLSAAQKAEKQFKGREMS
jgi:peptidoglycan/xylan/chitin deacetylase (PgdA/CDA1 family)